jgi:hypothetical protein
MRLAVETLDHESKARLPRREQTKEFMRFLCSDQYMSLGYILNQGRIIISIEDYDIPSIKYHI